ncbi:MULTISPECIES: ADP-ribosylation/crystallin J1 [Catenuloplanes]|uniref:ADP-ribosylation/crystallin J1 n=1 Tax=Catenuloplanes TaxID=33874 RepID=UPI00286A55F7|nr:ADP-ribosylation/crystallin J1 [Catenuloplanes niger]
MAGRVENPDGTTTLWRPVGPAELDLIARSGYAAFPPRLPDQPIFYPVLNEAYAARIAAEWNVEASGAGHVTRFRVATDFARRYPSRQAGGREIAELWIPAEDVPELNAHLVGPIEVVSSSEDRAVSPGPFGEVPESE